ncbi:Gfo/Idh/MocA family oxidoreductase, partial [Candidatus Pelagibacter sp.]|nr:Gfo/Idh/MocA family oxidoreductase [Candidatus Pelagibacter sp.]
MNILIIGLGSIGQRHMRNIDLVYKNKVNFFAIRKKFKTPHLSKSNKPLISKVNKRYNLKNFNSLNEIKKQKIKIHAAFICTPTSEHLKSVFWLLKNDINIFIEKPLSNNLNKIMNLQKNLKKSKSITMMGYQMRFDPIINFLKNQKKIKKLIGNINYVQIDHGEDVRNFHSWEDYSKSYTSLKKLGGGVTLSQIHEFEYFQNIFSGYKVIKSKSIIEKVSNLKIDVDDTSSHIFLIKKKNNKIVCNLNLNFYEGKSNRQIKFIGN